MLNRLTNYRDLINMAPNDDGAGGAGDGGDAQSLDEKRVHEIVHKAIGDRLRRVDFSEQIQSALQSSMDSIKDVVSEQVAAALEANGGKRGEGDDEATNPQLEEMKKLLEAERNARLKSEQESQKAAEQRAREAERSKLQEALVGVNVRRELLPGALAHLLSEGKVKRDKQDNIVWATGDPLEPYAALDEGVKQWASTDTGKAWLAPRDVKGSGNRGGDPNAKGNSGGKVTDADINSYILGG